MRLTMDDLMSPDFIIYHTFDAILGHIPFWLRFIDLHGVACLFPLTGYTPRRWPICYLIMIPQWSLSGAIKPDPLFSAFGCHHASPFGIRLFWYVDPIQPWIWITRITHLIMDDLMSPDFLIYHTFDAILGHIPFWLRFIDLHGVACLFPLTGYTPRRWPICYLIMIPQWSLSGAIQPDPHFSTFGCHHASPFGIRLFWCVDSIQPWIWITRITRLMMDDLMSPDFLIYHTFDAILGHILFRLRFIDLHGVACLSPLTRYTLRWWPVRYLIMIPQWSFSGAIQPDPHFSAFRYHHASSCRKRLFDVWIWYSYGFGIPGSHVWW